MPGDCRSKYCQGCKITLLPPNRICPYCHDRSIELDEKGKAEYHAKIKEFDRVLKLQLEESRK
jgi:hypothetical protein